jgi:hypothetical protein
MFYKLLFGPSLVVIYCTLLVVILKCCKIGGQPGMVCYVLFFGFKNHSSNLGTYNFSLKNCLITGTFLHSDLTSVQLTANP